MTFIISRLLDAAFVARISGVFPNLSCSFILSRRQSGSFVFVSYTTWTSLFRSLRRINLWRGKLPPTMSSIWDQEKTLVWFSIFSFISSEFGLDRQESLLMFIFRFGCFFSSSLIDREMLLDFFSSSLFI